MPAGKEILTQIKNRFEVKNYRYDSFRKDGTADDFNPYNHIKYKCLTRFIGFFFNLSGDKPYN